MHIFFSVFYPKRILTRMLVQQGAKCTQKKTYLRAQAADYVSGSSPLPADLLQQPTFEISQAQSVFVVQSLGHIESRELKLRDLASKVAVCVNSGLRRAVGCHHSFLMGEEPSTKSCRGTKGNQLESIGLAFDPVGIWIRTCQALCTQNKTSCVALESILRVNIKQMPGPRDFRLTVWCLGDSLDFVRRIHSLLCLKHSDKLKAWSCSYALFISAPAGVHELSAICNCKKCVLILKLNPIVVGLPLCPAELLHRFGAFVAALPLCLQA